MKAKNGKVDLSVIVSCYNNRDIIGKTLNSLRDSFDSMASAGYLMEVMVFDNASADGSARFIKENYPWAKLIENSENIGFSKGNNSAKPYARGKLLLFLNGDTEFGKDVLPAMVRYMYDNNDVGVATCRIDLHTGDLDKDCRRGEMTPWNTFCRILGVWKLFPKSKLFNAYYYGHISDKIKHEVYAVQGAFLLTRKKLADEVGWWDEDYFLNAEDIDFCTRIRNLGYKVMYNPSVRIIHYRGYSKGTREMKSKLSPRAREIKQMVARESVNSMEKYYKKHMSNRYPFFINWLIYLGLKILKTVRVLRYKVF